MRINEARHDDGGPAREAEGKIVQKIDVAAGRARRSAPRCRFQLSHGVGETNFSIQFPDGSHKGLFMKRSPRVEVSANGRQDAARDERRRRELRSSGFDNAADAGLRVAAGKRYQNN